MGDLSDTVSAVKWLPHRRWVHKGVATRLVVAIPARNEAERLAACLAALDNQHEAIGGKRLSEPFGVVLFLNGCTDASFDIAVSMAPTLSYPLRIFDGDLPFAFNHAGGARRVAMDLAAEWIDENGEGSGYILTTDADSRPSSTWIADTGAAFAIGADAVAGRIELDSIDEATLSAALRARGALEDRYESLVTELDARLDPRLHDPWPRHASAPGASLALTLMAYRRIGGLPAVESGEDRALVAAIENAGLKLRHDPNVSVITSGRLIGRARGGVADALALRTANPQAACDPYLEPALRVALRAYLRGKLRAVQLKGTLADWAMWAPLLGLSKAQGGDLARECSFSVFWNRIEVESPALKRKSLRPRDLPLQIRIAEIILHGLRHAPFRQSLANRVDSQSCAPADEASQSLPLPLETP